MPLKHVPRAITPELLHILARMGHGDELLIADANFPAHGQGVSEVLRCDGSSSTDILQAVLELFPLDSFASFQAAVMKQVDSEEDAPIVSEFQRILDEVYSRDGSPVSAKLERVERFAFYQRAKSVFAICATGESRLYGNIIIKKGVLDGSGRTVMQRPTESTSSSKKQKIQEELASSSTRPPSYHRTPILVPDVQTQGSHMMEVTVAPVGASRRSERIRASPQAPLPPELLPRQSLGRGSSRSSISSSNPDENATAGKSSRSAPSTMDAATKDAQETLDDSKSSSKSSTSKRNNSGSAKGGRSARAPKRSIVAEDPPAVSSSALETTHALAVKDQRETTTAVTEAVDVIRNSTVASAENSESSQTAVPTTTETESSPLENSKQAAVTVSEHDPASSTVDNIPPIEASTATVDPQPASSVESAIKPQAEPVVSSSTAPVTVSENTCAEVGEQSLPSHEANVPKEVPVNAFGRSRRAAALKATEEIHKSTLKPVPPPPSTAESLPSGDEAVNGSKKRARLSAVSSSGGENNDGVPGAESAGLKASNRPRRSRVVAGSQDQLEVNDASKIATPASSGRRRKQQKPAAEEDEEAAKPRAKGGRKAAAPASASSRRARRDSDGASTVNVEEEGDLGDDDEEGEEEEDDDGDRAITLFHVGTFQRLSLARRREVEEEQKKKSRRSLNSLSAQQQFELAMKRSITETSMSPDSKSSQ